VGLGTYSREYARDVRQAAASYGIEALITDDYLDVEARITATEPELVLGTQMERHICKRLGIPCAVISSPVHVQDFPARYSPQMGFEGANVLFDTWVHPLMMGLEEHLLAMFREDSEFGEGAAPSHLGIAPASVMEAAAVAADAPAMEEAIAADVLVMADATWDAEAEKQLKRIPIFVRGKARRNTEAFARERGLASITLQTLYDARAHYAR
jgi:light-independent protochlorophyllide reductase subunit B